MDSEKKSQEIRQGRRRPEGERRGSRKHRKDRKEKKREVIDAKLADSEPDFRQDRHGYGKKHKRHHKRRH